LLRTQLPNLVEAHWLMRVLNASRLVVFQKRTRVDYINILSTAFGWLFSFVTDAGTFDAGRLHLRHSNKPLHRDKINCAIRENGNATVKVHCATTHCSGGQLVVMTSAAASRVLEIYFPVRRQACCTAGVPALSQNCLANVYIGWSAANIVFIYLCCRIPSSLSNDSLTRVWS